MVNNDDDDDDNRRSSRDGLPSVRIVASSQISETIT